MKYTYDNGVKGDFSIYSTTVQERTVNLCSFLLVLTYYFLFYSVYEYIHQRSTLTSLISFNLFTFSIMCSINKYTVEPAEKSRQHYSE